MTNYAFEIRKWPKRHEHLVEECRELNVSQLVGLIPLYNVQNFIPWSHPTQPHLSIVPARAGFSVRWWLLCTSCRGRYGTIYALPDGDPGDWKCRKCHNLIYASQRHGHRHPLRKILTPLKRSRRRKEAIRQNRIFARQESKQKNRLEKVDPELSREKMVPFLREFKSFIDSGGSITIKVDQSRLAKAENPSKNNLADGSNEMEDEAISDALKVVREIAENNPSKINRRRAQKMLDQFPPLQEVPVKKPSSGSSEYTEEELQKIIGAINSMYKKPRR